MVHASDCMPYRVWQVPMADAALHWAGMVCRRHGDDASFLLGARGTPTNTLHQTA